MKSNFLLSLLFTVKAFASVTVFDPPGNGFRPQFAQFSSDGARIHVDWITDGPDFKYFHQVISSETGLELELTDLHPFLPMYGTTYFKKNGHLSALLSTTGGIYGKVSVYDFDEKKIVCTFQDPKRELLNLDVPVRVSPNGKRLGYKDAGRQSYTIIDTDKCAVTLWGPRYSSLDSLSFSEDVTQVLGVYSEPNGSYRESYGFLCGENFGKCVTKSLRDYYEAISFRPISFGQTSNDIFGSRRGNIELLSAADFKTTKLVANISLSGYEKEFNFSEDDPSVVTLITQWSLGGQTYNAAVLDVVNNKVLYEFTLPGGETYNYLSELDKSKAESTFLDLKTKRLIVNQNQRLQVFDITNGKLLVEHRLYQTPFLRKSGNRIIHLNYSSGKVRLFSFDYRTLDHREMTEYKGSDYDIVAVNELGTQFVQFSGSHLPGKRRVYFIDTTKP